MYRLRVFISAHLDKHFGVRPNKHFGVRPKISFSSLFTFSLVLALLGLSVK